MPKGQGFRSKAQQRFFFAAQKRGDLPRGTAQRWAKETRNFKRLPQRISVKRSSGRS